MTTQKHKLAIELVPSTVWYLSIYQYYKKSGNMQKWSEIKEELFAREGNKCWLCGNKSGHLEAHEFWKYDDIAHIQRLEAIHHLCELCHKVKHIGLWLHTKNGERMLNNKGLTKDDIITHFSKVNSCPKEEFRKYEAEALRIWRERSKYKWKQDFGSYDPKLLEQKQKNSTLNQFI